MKREQGDCVFRFAAVLRCIDVLDWVEIFQHVLKDPKQRRILVK